ncbi:MAG: hypothetical protein IT488_03090 [Gammaproteobacteria bacterium]|nr:hypothetical protein [Gammaproteobacteria bacterium]
MAGNPCSGHLITGTDLREYFQHTIDDALTTQGVDAAVETVYYIVDLLTAYQRADRLYEQTPDGFELKPLAIMYAEALQLPYPQQRNQMVQRLGDVALFISGVFSESLIRKPVDVDYYIAMGSNAYGYLSDAMRGTARGAAFCAIFTELSHKFPKFVAALACVREGGEPNTDTDILRIYDQWLRTGDRGAGQRLRELGINRHALSAESVRH